LTAARVVPGLWQGSAPTPGMALPFDAVVLAACGHQPPGKRIFGPRAEVVRVPLTDGGMPLSPRDLDRALRAAVWIGKTHESGKRLLVTCEMGWNRSGLLVALALVFEGYSADAAVMLVRQARGRAALGNAHFEAYVHGVARALGQIASRNTRAA